MRGLVVSNIAWAPAHDVAAAELLRASGVSGVEVAPTTRWSDVRAAGPADALAWRDDWLRHGLAVTSMQSLLFGQPALRVFGDATEVEALVEYLDHVFAIAAALGAGPLVFGSPANRRAGDRSPVAANEAAAPVFARLGAAAARHGVTLCIEPNPPQYGCDFLTDTAAAVAFLEQVGGPGLGLHLDAAAIFLNGEDVDRVVDLAAPWLRHYHASEPYLAPLGAPVIAHARHARALARAGYDGLVSIEMKALPGADEVATCAHLTSALDVVTEAYAPLLR
jgi:sugar phosphate isomerase/epimerase